MPTKRTTLTLYAVLPRAPHRDSSDVTPEGWQGHILTLRPGVGDVIAGSVRLVSIDWHGLPQETKPPLRLQVSDVDGPGRYAGKCVLPRNSAQCLCNALNWVDDPHITLHTDTEELWDAHIQQSRVGSDWRPVADIAEETQRLTPAVLALVPGAEVIEARRNSHLFGSGENVALLRQGDDYSVLEWGTDPEDARDWHHLRPLAEHNVEVAQSNQEWQEA